MERKISSPLAADIPKTEIAEKGRAAKTPLYTVMGRMNGTKVNDHPEYGTSYGLRGTFEATSLHTGEVRTAPVFWPPTFLSEILINEFESAKEQGDATLLFAYEIGVKPDKETQLGYKYYFDALRDPEQAKEYDPFAGLREAVTERNTLALEDKTKGDEKEDGDKTKKKATK